MTPRNDPIPRTPWFDSRQRLFFSPSFDSLYLFSTFALCFPKVDSTIAEPASYHLGAPLNLNFSSHKVNGSFADEEAGLESPSSPVHRAVLSSLGSVMRSPVNGLCSPNLP
jgi:hypothetical protein